MTEGEWKKELYVCVCVSTDSPAGATVTHPGEDEGGKRKRNIWKSELGTISARK